MHTYYTNRSRIILAYARKMFQINPIYIMVHMTPTANAFTLSACNFAIKTITTTSVAT